MAQTNRSRRGHATGVRMLALTLLATAGAPAGAVAAEPAIEVGGALPKTGALTLSDLEAMEPIKATWVTPDGKHEVYGVPLDRVLTRFGFAPGPMGRNVPVEKKLRGWRQAVIGSAADGYAAVLSCAEIFESMGATRALVIWKMDDNPLPSNLGPFRLVVLTDKEPARSVYGLRKLQVVDVRAP
jgi:hypothetical protein